jgi:hypothetical protein
MPIKNNNNNNITGEHFNPSFRKGKLPIFRNYHHSKSNYNYGNRSWANYLSVSNNCYNCSSNLDDYDCSQCPNCKICVNNNGYKSCVPLNRLC